jgi:hypothetical protein
VKPPAAAAHADVALGPQGVDGACRERPRGGHRREAQPHGRGVPGPVLLERGELAEQSLSRVGLLRSGLLGDVGAQRLHLADRDLVRCTSPLHDL